LQLTLITEIFKLVVAVLALKALAPSSTRVFPSTLQPGYALTACLYLIVNNLEYYALQMLPLATVLICQQSKILFTAGLTKVILGRPPTMREWAACVLLAVGVSLGVYDTLAAPELDFDPNNVKKGLVAIALMSACSGLSNVWTELMMKRSSASVTSAASAADVQKDAGEEHPLVSFFQSSIQLYIIGIPLYLLAYLGDTIAYQTPTTALPPHLLLFLCFNGSLAGMFIGAVFKFASALTRVFVQGISFVVSVACQKIVFHQSLGQEGFFVGANLVLLANAIYKNAGDVRSRRTWLMLAGAVFLLAAVMASDVESVTFTENARVVVKAAEKASVTSAATVEAPTNVRPMQTPAKSPDKIPDKIPADTKDSKKSKDTKAAARAAEINGVISNSQRWQSVNYPRFVTFVEILESNNIPYSLDSGTLLGAVRDGAPTLWDDDFDVMVEDNYKRNIKALCKEYIDDDEERQAYWAKMRKDPKYSKRGPPCTVTMEDGLTFHLRHFSSGYVWICYSEADNPSKCTHVLDIFFPSTMDWPAPPDKGKFPLVKRKFGDRYFYAYNDPVPYLDLMYAKEWKDTYRVYSHDSASDSAYFPGSRQKYHKVGVKEYSKLKMKWGKVSEASVLQV
jgi:drug/metabolite transporter (DMT)-like permease